MTDILYLDTNQALGDFAADAQGNGWLALDTEFMRERTYFPKLCLVQISDGEHIACIDPLVINDLKPLNRLLQDPNILKILHSAEQDLEVLSYTLGAPPAPLFDTQLAAALCGYGDQVGYANLAKEMLGVELAKAHTRANWGRRPLKPAEIEYAADDVRHLGPLYERLRDELQSCGRLGWLEQDLRALDKPERYLPDPAQAWRRLRGLVALGPGDQHMAAALAAWREEQAMHADLPRRWVLDDTAILELARRKPADLQGLHQIDEIKPGFIKRHGQAVLSIIQQKPAHEASLIDAPARLEDQQKTRLRQLKTQLKQIAHDEQISASLIANSKDLEKLLRGDTDLRLLSGWRKQVAGDKLLRSLADETDST